MKNELFRIGPFIVYGYGLMIALGIVVGFLIAEYRARKRNMDIDQLIGLSIAVVVGGFIGSKLLYWLTELNHLVKDPTIFWDTLLDGFVVYGGIIGGIIGGLFYCRRKTMDFFVYFDLLVPSLAIAQGFGRIGCFLAGCCYGKETKSALHIVFKSSEYAPNGISLIPTQLYSAGLDVILFMVLLYVAKHIKKTGITAAVYLILYSVGRFFLEFFRGDLIRGSVGILSTSQFIAIFTCLLGIVIFYWSWKKSAK